MPSPEPATFQLRPGDRVGNYVIREQIGEGGFAIVYAAEQEKPVRRKVALKIIKLGMDTKQVIARFEAERQALAMMDHPNVAKVFDAGATETGRPYFVMEYVAGAQITEYCDKQRLTIEDRLGLFGQVCEGVQHAHQKGIIHRDIKPSNVLVHHQDGKHVPKIIDFGVAKAMAQRLTEKTFFTEMGQLIGTPQYMSPEQAEMTGLDIDTRTRLLARGPPVRAPDGHHALRPEDLHAGGLRRDPAHHLRGGAAQAEYALEFARHRARSASDGCCSISKRFRIPR